MLTHVRPALLLLGVMTALTGVAVPLVVTGIAQLLFPRQANGSLIVVNGKAVGSALIGQPFDDAKYFWSRPSATSPFPYNAGASSGSNLGPTNPALASAVRARSEALRAADPGNAAPVPVDLVTASGSGLDPHISPAGALYQVPRVARARAMDEAAVRLAARIGLLRTMVFTHLPSNLLLIAVAFAPDLTSAIVLLLARFALSQMDVPTRQAYVMAVVDPSERTAAAAYTNTARYLTRPIAPLCTSVTHSAPSDPAANAYGPPSSATLRATVTRA